MQRFLTMALLLVVCACSNTVASLRYTAPAPLWTATAPSIAAVTATDERKEAPTRLATIMGGYGNPLKTLDTAKPVKNEIIDAVVAGLRARGMLDPSGQAPIRLDILVRKFDADMIIGRTARIDLTFSAVDPAGRVIYRENVVDHESDMKFFETGILANIVDLQVLCETVLNRTVNQTLDKPEFREALDAGRTKPLPKH